MNTQQAHAAARETMLRTFGRAWVESHGPKTSRAHLEDMVARMELMDDQSKANRWLGWLQACVVMQTTLQLEDMRAVNASVLGLTSNQNHV